MKPDAPEERAFSVSHATPVVKSPVNPSKIANARLHFPIIGKSDWRGFMDHHKEWGIMYAGLFLENSSVKGRG